MKNGIHPQTRMVKYTCSCGNVVEVISTLKDEVSRIEICSKCHPFYTGERKILKTWSVDKFYARQAKTKELSK